MLSVSRTTVRKVIRGQATEFKYERGVQPTPKLGEWVAVLSELLEKDRSCHGGNGARLSAPVRELRGRAMTVRTTVCTGSVKAWRDEQARVQPRHSFP